MNKLLKSFGWAMNGVKIVWREEITFRVEAMIAFIVLVLAWLLNFSPIDWTIIIGCIGAVLSSEMVNTAIEDLCNKVEPNTDASIGKIKDVMAGFVLTIAVASAIIGVMIFSRYI